MKSPSLAAAPQLADWLDLSRDGIIVIRTGKVEIGQGVLTALVQIAAQNLGVSPEQVEVVSGVTGVTPNEGYTAGSLSIPHSGTAIETACGACVELYRNHAAKKFGAAAEGIRIENGTFSGPGMPGGVTLWTVFREMGLGFEVTEAAGKSPANRPAPSLPRIDLRQKMTGGGLIQDIAADDMLHASILRPPRFGARLEASTLSDADRSDLVIEGSFVAVVGEDLLAVARKADRLRPLLEWAGGIDITPEMLRPENLRDLPHEIVEIGEMPADDESLDTVSATYTRPYLMHGSIGCVAALARWSDDGKLAVTSQTQGPYQLRDALAVLFAMDRADVSVTHAPGAGCYGHNGADDVAADAALVARHFPERTVRVTWSRADELSCSPLAPAGNVVVRAQIGEDGRPVSLTLDIAGATHARRPGTAPAGTLLGELHRAEAQYLPEPIEIPPIAGWGGLRNAVSDYSIADQYAKLRLVDPPGLRTSAMRGLGTQVNVLAIESFIDELALRAGADPLDYRLSLLDDPRAREVLIRVAESSDWAGRPEAGTGHGWGIAYSRYKGRAAYVAMVARVTVEESVHLDKVWCWADAGRVINMDGLRNQIEGGIIQAASWTLIEEVRLTDDGTLPQTWEDYPIMRFSEIPEIALDVIDTAEPEPLGAGEVAVGPTTAAIANAVAHALGSRLRNLPFSRENVMEALLRT